jgi:hypothetical protein
MHDLVPQANDTGRGLLIETPPGWAREGYWKVPLRMTVLDAGARMITPPHVALVGLLVEEVVGRVLHKRLITDVC